MKVGFSQISCVDERRWHGWKCSWVITRYRCYLAVWWEVNLSDLLGAAQRPEFKVGDPEAKLAAGLAEQHQPATTCMLLLSQPPWILFPPPPRALWQASSASQPYPTPTPHICIWSVHHTAWILRDGNSMASAANVAFILSPGWFSHPARATIYRIFYLGPATKMTFFSHL